MQARFLDPTDAACREAWAGLLAYSPQATPYSHIAYAEALHEATGRSFRLAGVLEGESLRAGVLLFERQRGPYRTVVVPPLTAYTSILLDRPLRETEIHQRKTPLDALLVFLDAHFHALALHLHPSLADVRPFIWAGWRACPLYTYCCPMREEAELLKAVSRGVRRRFERERPDLAIEEGSFAPAITGLIEQSYARSEGVSPLDPARRAAFFERLRETGLARLFAASAQGSEQPSAGQAVLTDGNSAFALAGGGTPGPAMSVLLTEILLRLHEEGLRELDFVGANTPSIAEFKRSFAPRLTPYFRVERFVRPELRLLHALRSLF